MASRASRARSPELWKGRFSFSFSCMYGENQLLFLETKKKCTLHWIFANKPYQLLFSNSIYPQFSALRSPSPLPLSSHLILPPSVKALYNLPQGLYVVSLSPYCISNKPHQCDSTASIGTKRHWKIANDLFIWHRNPLSSNPKPFDKSYGIYTHKHQLHKR